MTSFQKLLHQPLGVVFIDEVNGQERWQVFTGVVIPSAEGLAVRFSPQTRPAFHLDPEWEERLRVVPDSMRDRCAADYMIYVKVSPLPPNANLDDYSPTSINLNKGD